MSSFATAASKHRLETSSKAILQMSIKGPSHSMNKTQTQVLLAREIGILTAQLTNYKEWKILETPNLNMLFRKRFDICVFAYIIITFKDTNKRDSMRYDWAKKKGKEREREGDLEIVVEASRPIRPSKVTTSKPTLSLPCLTSPAKPPSQKFIQINRPNSSESKTKR